MVNKNRCSLSFFLLWLPGLFGVAESSCAQEESIFTPSFRLQIKTSLQGEKEVETTPFFDILFVPEQSVLGEREVWNELELSDNQRSQMEALFSEIDAEKRTLAKEYRVNSSQPTVLNRFRRVKERVCRKIDDILLEHQKKRLRAIAEYIELRKLGIKKYVSVLSRKSKLSYASNQFEQQVELVVKNLNEESIESGQEHLSRILRPLSSSQRALLEKVFSQRWLGRIDLEGLYLDLSQPRKDNLKKDRSTASMLFEASLLRLDDAGQWARIRPDASSSPNSTLNLAWVVKHHHSSFVELDLSEGQVLEISRLISWHQEETLLLRKDFQEREDFSTPAQAAYRDAKHKLYSQFDSKFYSVVPESQLDALKGRFVRRTAIADGLISSITTETWLIERLSITSEQLTKIKSIASKELKLIREEMRKLESESMSLIKAELPSSLSNLLPDLATDAPKHLDPSFVGIR